jgi:hypothetical protein
MGELSMVSKKGESVELDKHTNLPFSNEEYLFRYAKSYMAYRDFDALPIAREIRQRAFVLMGKQDLHSPMENSEAVGDSIKDAERFVDGNGDHYEFCRLGSSTLEAIAAHLAEVT